MGKNPVSAQADSGLLLAALIKLLQDIDKNGTLADLNQTSISDNNGGRITL